MTTMQTIGQFATDNGTVSVNVTFDGEVEMTIIDNESRRITVIPLGERLAAQLGNALSRASIAAEKVSIPHVRNVA